MPSLTRGKSVVRMCGIFGLVLGEGHAYNGQQVIAAIDQLFRISESRGREAAGLAVVHPDCINVIKSAESASAFLRSVDYNSFAKTLANRVRPGEPLAILGHARLVTNGVQAMDANNQPTIKRGVVVVHNGIIVNDAKLWDRHPELLRHA